MENQEAQNKCECGCQQSTTKQHNALPNKKAVNKVRTKTPARFTGNSTFDFYFHELILTFTTEKSLFSSKKIERFLVFSVFIIITIIYVFFNIKKIESLELVELMGLWLAYGGYNTFQGYKDKKLRSAKPPVPEEISYEEEDGDEIKF